MNMKSKLFASVILSFSALFSMNTFANADQAKMKAEFEAMSKQYSAALESAAKSSDVRGGLIKACGIQYKKTIEMKLLTSADVTKLCSCTIDAEGKITGAEKWEVQSAINAKNQEKLVKLRTAMVKKQGESVKKCVGTTLDQKLSKLAQQAQAPK